MKKSIQNLAGANMDIDLTSSDQITWHQEKCPWNEKDKTDIHKCAIKNISKCSCFRGIEYLDTILCCYPNDNSQELTETSVIDNKIPFELLDFEFSSKPLLIGGLAMEYYGLRQAGADTDFVITNEDYRRLAQKYPENKRDLWGDLGVAIHGFEIWRSICWLDYDFLSERGMDAGKYLVVSFEKLLFMRVLAIENEKYGKDLKLMVKRVLENQNKEFQRDFELSGDEITLSDIGASS